MHLNKARAVQIPRDMEQSLVDGAALPPSNQSPSQAPKPRSETGKEQSSMTEQGRLFTNARICARIFIQLLPPPESRIHRFYSRGRERKGERVTK